MRNETVSKFSGHGQLGIPECQDTNLTTAPDALAKNPAQSERLTSIDLARGLVMSLMALDHVRDYFSNTPLIMDPARTTVALFFTRWITHFCAPAFFLLAGVGAYLSISR